MEIRKLKQNEISMAMFLVKETFYETVAKEFTVEGVQSFCAFIELENIQDKIEKYGMILWGAFEQGELMAVLALDNRGHINLLFAEKMQQKKGYGSALMVEAYQYCKYQLGVKKITVNATISAISWYEKFGFRSVAQELDAKGIRYVPMELVVFENVTSEIVRTSTFKKEAEKRERKNQKRIIAGILIGALLLTISSALFLGAFLGKQIHEITQGWNSGSWYRESPFDDDFYFDYYDDEWGF